MENAATTSSPSKRRALAPLDANALSSPKPAATKGSPLRRRVATEAYAASAMVAASAAAAPSLGGSPRPLKRVCLEDANRSRSRTPEGEDESSLFDNNDSSWATNTTPDVSPAPRTLTREQAREKAEILRLRLGLAGYKVRTGQTSVPLANLVAKPLPRRTTAATTTNTISPRRVVDKVPDEQKQQQQPQKDTSPPRKEEDAALEPRKEEEGEGAAGGHGCSDVEGDDANDAAGVEVELPPLRRAAAAAATATPRHLLGAGEEQEALTSSAALRGGAASGLLSLARGGSSG